MRIFPASIIEFFQPVKNKRCVPMGVAYSKVYGFVGGCPGRRNFEMLVSI